MPQMTGIELMEQSRTHAPGAKLLLLTAYADTDVAITAINAIGLDYYLLKPWDPPEDRLYPIVDDLLGDWRRANPARTSEVRIVGHRWSERSHDLKIFLARNHVPYAWFDVERDDEGRRLRDLAAAGPDELPLVLVPDGGTLRAPSTSTSPARSGCTSGPSSRCTTCASSAPARPAWPPPSTRRPRGCAPCWWSGRRRAGRRARAPRSRTTSASRAA